MRVAHVWYRPEERDLVRQLLGDQRPDWELVGIPEGRVSSFSALLRLLEAGYDVLLVHLSLPYCLALKAAELAHRNALHVRILLFSRTHAQEDALRGLFDAMIHPEKDIMRLTDLIDQAVRTARVVITSPEELQDRIVTIFNTSKSLISHYYLNTQRQYSDRETDFGYSDYEQAILASQSVNRHIHDVFLSYASADEVVAYEIKGAIEEGGVDCFMANHGLEVGALWQDRIRVALQDSTVVVVLMTPASTSLSRWVLIEAGAAWLLDKPVVPLYYQTLADQAPEIVSSHQGRIIETRDQLITAASDIVTIVDATQTMSA